MLDESDGVGERDEGSVVCECGIIEAEFMDRSYGVWPDASAIPSITLVIKC